MRVFHKVKQRLLSRSVITIALIAIQLAIIIYFAVWLSRYFIIMYSVFEALSVIVMLYVVNKVENPAYKLAWVVPILLFPVFGGLLYLILGNKRENWILKRYLKRLTANTPSLLIQSERTTEFVSSVNPTAANQSRYLRDVGFPAYSHTETIYHASGESKFASMCEVLERAERFIFLEYFIIKQGVMWDTVLEILVRKAAEGVEVRLIYDGFGCMDTLPEDYPEALKEAGIQCCIFNQMIPALNILMNNRDHRKILVIDGEIGFMGGINLADEYINVKERFGHWKDSAIELRGLAVWSLTVMFLQMWHAETTPDKDPPSEYTHYQSPASMSAYPECGIVQPYADSPLDEELVSEMVYLNLINRAHNYLYICTPYLVIDNETVTSLLLAAKSGVDVRIITPHIPDKWYVHTITRSYYKQLIQGGVKIYEYTPGFIHAKNFVVDDEIATVGTVNLDYRSLYLHFECGVWMYKASAVTAIRDDFLETLKLCTPVIEGSPILKANPFVGLIRAILRLFAPLM